MPDTGTVVDNPTTVGRGSHSPVERVTVNLNARASTALERVAALTGESKTDAINRALQVYAMLHELQDGGGAVYTRERGGSELERLRIL